MQGTKNRGITGENPTRNPGLFGNLGWHHSGVPNVSLNPKGYQTVIQQVKPKPSSGQGVCAGICVVPELSLKPQGDQTLIRLMETKP